MTGMITSNYAATFSGKNIDLDVIDIEDIEIVDIAVGLANQCRYAGQVWPFYSVAEHSILTSFLVPDENDLQLKALLHDAPEFILHDIIRPVKRKIGGTYTAMETYVHAAIEARFDLKYSCSDWAEIKRVDDLITMAERRTLMPRLDPSTYGRGVIESHIPKVAFQCSPPAEAALQFLNRYFFLSSRTATDNQSDLIDILTQSVR